MLSREEHKQLLTRLLESPEPANISDAVTQLADNYAEVLADLAINRETSDSLRRQNDDLVQQNMKLFLKIGEGEPKDDQIEIPEEKKVLRFDDLVNESGHIF